MFLVALMSRQNRMRSRLCFDFGATGHYCRDREIRHILQLASNEFRDLNDTSSINKLV